MISRIFIQFRNVTNSIFILPGWTLVGPAAAGHHPSSVVPTSSNNGGILKPQVTSWVLQDSSGGLGGHPISSVNGNATTTSVSTCDMDDIKYGPFSDGEADKCHQHYNRPRQNRSRSLPRRPASSMMVSYRPLQPHEKIVSSSSTLHTYVP